MVVISKPFFDTAMTSVSCNEVVHPWTKSCFKAAPTLLAASLLGSAKFYSLIYLVQVVIGRKKLHKKEQWIKIAKNYVRSTVTGMLISVTGFQLVCLFRNLLEKYTYYTFVTIPFTLSNLWLYLETPGRRRWITNAFCNMLIEYYLRSIEKAGYLTISKTKKVLMFMISNALLLYLMRLERYKEADAPLFWLFTPEKVRKGSDECTNVCPHEGDCMKYILKGASVYFGFALAYSIGKVIVGEIKTPISAISSIKARNLKLAFFLGSYIGIYRAIICYLCRKNGYDSALFALPAGCLAGISFAFSPNLGWTIVPFTAALKLYSTTLYEKKMLPSSIHLPIAVCCFCQGILFSARILNSDVCPRYIFHVMNSISNGLSDRLAANFHEIVKKAF